LPETVLAGRESGPAPDEQHRRRAVRYDRQLPHFDVLWQVDTASRSVASRTSFDRVEVVSATWYDPYYFAYYAGYGPFWWYDPLYSGIVFANTRPIAIHDRGAPITVGGFDGHFAAAGHR
jgi:hypothetical protein